MRTAALVAAIVVFSNGMVAAPIAASSRIDDTQVLETGSEPETRWQSVLLLPGDQPVIPLAEAEAPEPPAFAMSITGIGLGGLVLWRRRSLKRQRRRRRKARIVMREMAPLFD